MKLTTAFRDKPTVGFTGTKEHYLACHVEFTHEERAIVQERGLYDFETVVAAATPAPTRTGDFLAMLMRMAGIVLAPLGLLMSCAQSARPDLMAGAGIWPMFMLVLGVSLFAIGKFNDWKANKRECQPAQRLTLRRLLANPDFIVYAPSLDIAQLHEQQAREALSRTAQFIRDNAAVPAQTSYTL